MAHIQVGPPSTDPSEHLLSRCRARRAEQGGQVPALVEDTMTGTTLHAEQAGDKAPVLLWVGTEGLCGR